MDIKSYRAYDPGATRDVILAVAAAQTLNGLDRFLGFVEEQLRDLAEDLPKALLQRMASETLSGAGADRDAVLRIATDCRFADRFTGLFLGHLDLIHGLLGIDPSNWESREKRNVLRTKFTAAQHVPRYLQLKALEDVAGRDAAMDTMRRFLDWNIAQRPPSTDGPKTIAEMCKQDIPWNLSDQGQDAVTALVSEHQLLKKVTACRTHKVLAPYADGEMMEVVACYPDFASIRRTNPSFALTRTQNLVSGGTYCDTCFHDERYVSDFVHPSREAFAALSHS